MQVYVYLPTFLVVIKQRTGNFNLSYIYLDLYYIQYLSHMCSITFPVADLFCAVIKPMNY